MEDQTDEDFFDKLVEDDIKPVKSGPSHDESNDSDDAKALANLGISDGDAAFQNLDDGENSVGSVRSDAGSVAGGEQEGNSVVASSSGGCDHNTDTSNLAMGLGLASASIVSKSDGIASSGVKVIGWNSFHADSDGDVQFGSYSDFFSALRDQSADFTGTVNPGNAYDNLNNEVNPVGNAIKKGGLNTSVDCIQYQEGQGYDASLENPANVQGDGLTSSVNYLQYQEGQGYDASLDKQTNVLGDGLTTSVNYMPYQEGQAQYTSSEKHTSSQDLSSSQYWEDLYPGWRYDRTTGQWYQVDGYDAASIVQGNAEANAAVGWTAASDGKTEVGLHQTTQSVSGTSVDTAASENVSHWNQVSQGNNGYPKHMVFDPQYPDWYYDTIAQEWRSLETYNTTIQSAGQRHENGQASTSNLSNNDNGLYVEHSQAITYGSQNVGSRAPDSTWSSSYSGNHQHGFDLYTTETAKKSWDSIAFSGNQQFNRSYDSDVYVNKNQQNTFGSFGSVALYNKANQNPGLANGTVQPQSFVLSRDIVQQSNYSNTYIDEQKPYSNDVIESPKPFSHSQQPVQGGYQYSYAPHSERSSAGRPPHALVTFGFGGKLIIMKDSSVLSSYGNQGAVQGSISVLNLMEVVMGNKNSSSTGNGSGDYFRALSQQSFPGPLVGGSVGSKELYKWIDERIARCESPDMDYKKGERLRLLLSLLKIACQHYGKLRSPFGTDTILKANDTPESAVAKLFAAAKMNGREFTQYGMRSHCLQNLPSEGQMKAMASKVQNMLVSGKKKEALQCARDGQLWGIALVLASQLGEQYHVDTVKQMALCQLVAGSPLRTLCLLIAGQPAEVFCMDTSISGHADGFDMSQQLAQVGSNGMLDDWEENLAIISANRTKGDELVIMHLGDCLWKERSEITAAHICYLVAEANFELYSDTARLCLIGGDHWKFPRTYASPEAIQRTELYEYSKVHGNSQFILHPFQPYKLIYAYMLAEVGRVSDSLKYCQALLKSLKTGRAPEVETWKQLVLSLEERIRTYQQGGYATNLAPAKLVGKLLNFFDSTAHRVVGGLPPPAPSSSQGMVHGGEQHYQQISSSQSTMAMSSLVPSASMEPMSEWTADNNKTPKPNRSASEPDIGRTPRQGTTSPDSQGKEQVSGGTSRFSRFGFGSQLFQKTVGLVLRPRPGKQAKLGEKNKFYYDEKLKRWVEEGAEPPAEEAALPPPPTTAAFQNGSNEYNLKSALTTSEPSDEVSNRRISSPESISGMPPIPPSSNQFSSIPPSSNQFSARGRLGVRSRYVDTFNQGGRSSANLFQSPPVASVKPALASNAKFFIPAPAPAPAPLSNEQTMESIAEGNQEDSAGNGDPSTSATNDWSYQSPKHASSMVMQRFPSSGNFSKKGAAPNANKTNLNVSRRTASWSSGSFNFSFSPPKTGEVMPLGEVLGMPPSTYMPDESSLMHPSVRSSSIGEDLHEVEL